MVLEEFLNMYPFYQHKDIYLSGEKLAAKYIPKLVEKLVDTPQLASVLPVKGLLLENPVIESAAKTNRLDNSFLDIPSFPPKCHDNFESKSCKNIFNHELPLSADSLKDKIMLIMNNTEDD